MNTLVKVIQTIPFSLFYYKLNDELENIQQKKIAMNSTALFHAVSSVLLGLNYLKYKSGSIFMSMNTAGYVLFDMYYIFKDGKYDLLRSMYIYHHITLYSYMSLPATD